MKKNLFLALLLVLILSTSTFLVIESSKYYQKWYVLEYSLFLAILLESFVIVLAMSKVQWLALRIIQKTLMLCVFCIIVGSASLHHVSPIIKFISESTEQTKIESLIKEEILNLKDDFKVFDRQKQKLNTAKSANRRYEAFRGLLSTVNKKDDVSIALYLDIFILILIRLVLQTCNLFCASMVGEYYRVVKKKLKKTEYCICGCGQEIESGKIHIKGHNLKKKPVLKLRKK